MTAVRKKGRPNPIALASQRFGTLMGIAAYPPLAVIPGGNLFDDKLKFPVFIKDSLRE
jgi:hypothetical protein